ncbi:pullulanase X25 domain-containing protein [Arthrobacter mobilis]|uniref:Glycosidase n=1 Tax=Arthrobacter mobilis TaxID=2724944 RepID=A0A7X6HDV4_9MICC|nr:glycosidase [Arthrobacter mobilis]NKX54156.1 glycosidase [Arthrobacter mobilis]
MSANAQENNARRLKAVLDSLARAGQETKVGGSAVLAEAIGLFPLNAQESELLSGGVPRGHKTLTAATTRLVKAGWLVKGRGGWSITEEGLRATVAFPDAVSLATALAEGTPVPAGTPLPEQAPAEAAAVLVETVQLVDAVEQAESAEPDRTTADSTGKGSEEGTEDGTAGAAAAGLPAAPEEAAYPQPEAVALAGDFGTLMGCPEDWQPKFDEVQMRLDPADQLWKLTVDLPAGFYSFKAALNRSWDENYGAFGQPNGSNHELHHPGGPVTFRYDHRTKDITTSRP